MPAKTSTAHVRRASEPTRQSAAPRIVAGARRHFFAHGFRGVTMDDLAEELGMSKKTLYAHFASKTALLEAVIGDKLSRVEADLCRALDADDFPAQLHGLLACMRAHTEEIQPAFVRDVRREAPELFALIQEGRRKLIQRHFRRLLEAGRRAGSIRRDIPTKLLVEILIGGVEAIVNPARMEEFGLTPRTGFAHIVSVFLEGALVRKGGAKR